MFLNDKSLFLSVSQIKGVMNVLADGLSKPKPPLTEWKLDPLALEDSLAHPSTPGRLVCDLGEPTASGLRGTEPRPASNSYG